MTSLRDQVLEFHAAMGCPTLTTPTVPPDDRVRLRARLIVEECIEFLEACSPSAYGMLDSIRKEAAFVINESAPIVNLPAAVDALADIAYVVEGANLELGVDSGPVLAEVHRCNLAKSTSCKRCNGEGAIHDASLPYLQVSSCPTCFGAKRVAVKRADGKVAKPEGWQPPDIEGVLARQREKSE